MRIVQTGYPRGQWPRKPEMERFWPRVLKTKKCWLWTGAKMGTTGYGQFQSNKKRWYTHRFVYDRLVGSIPDGLHVCHTCDNPLCVRPSHLFLGTFEDNKKDMMSKNRQMKGEDCHFSKLNDDVVRYIRKNYNTKYKKLGQKFLAQKFNVNPSTIHLILAGKTWKHVRV